jgi:hypothetical protein
MNTTTPEAIATTIKGHASALAARLHTPLTAVTHYVAEFTLAAKDNSPTHAFEKLT